MNSSSSMTRTSCTGQAELVNVFHQSMWSSPPQKCINTEGPLSLTLHPGMCCCTARSSLAPCSRCSRDSGTYGSRKMGRTSPHMASAVLLHMGTRAEKLIDQGQVGWPRKLDAAADPRGKGQCKCPHSGMGLGSQNSQAISSCTLSAVASSRCRQHGEVMRDVA